MRFGIDSLNDIAELLQKRKLKYSDTIIVGDNSSGKSLLLKLLIEKFGKSDAVYFIDAVNRGFEAGMVVQENKKPEYKQTILNTRLEDEYFNLKDSFNCYGTRTERVEQIYYLFEEKLQSLFEQLTEEKFKIAASGVAGEVEFESGRGLLSSGYQAIVRILLELLFYQEKCLDEKKIKNACVVIDEADEFLSPVYEYKLLPFLKEQFPEMEFIVTTHSANLVAGSQDANLIVLENTGYEVLDANDYQSVSEVQIIFERLFGMHLTEETEIETELRRLLNNRINCVWTQREQQCLEKLRDKDLTASQQLIYKQIAEW